VPTQASSSPAPNEKTTLKTEIVFALTPVPTSARDNHPAHDDARDFKGLLAAISTSPSMFRKMTGRPDNGDTISKPQRTICRKFTSDEQILQTTPLSPQPKRLDRVGLFLLERFGIAAWLPLIY